jgi:transposase
VNHAGLLALSRDRLIALILAQHPQIEAQAEQISVLTACIGGLEAKLATPPSNSSLPPSKGLKANLPYSAEKPPRRGRPGVARALTEHPDKTNEATLTACPHCNHALGPADQSEIHAYDHIDVPPIHPFVTRIHRHSGVCPCCPGGSLENIRLRLAGWQGDDPGSILPVCGEL